jgi:hypothetical protein
MCEEFGINICKYSKEKNQHIKSIDFFFIFSLGILNLNLKLIDV